MSRSVELIFYFVFSVLLYTLVIVVPLDFLCYAGLLQNNALRELLRTVYTTRLSANETKSSDALSSGSNSTSGSGQRDNTLFDRNFDSLVRHKMISSPPLNLLTNVKNRCRELAQRLSLESKGLLETANDENDTNLTLYQIVSNELPLFFECAASLF
nr:MAG: hypothetical protein [Apis mellifra filamentous-like virus]